MNEPTADHVQHVSDETWSRLKRATREHLEPAAEATSVDDTTPDPTTPKRTP